MTPVPEYDPVLHVVHCIDTEGPLDEDIEATFRRIDELFGLRLEPSHEMLRALQCQTVPLDGLEGQVAAVVAPELLAYNRNWGDIRAMLSDALDQHFRREMVDDFGRGWVYSWHCLDHMGYVANPRRKDLGYGKVFYFYRDMLAATSSHLDEINWHFHPLSLSRQPLAAATSYSNSMDVLLSVIARRIIDDRWFPTTNRPGFHAERPDSHAFLEQWIPFDYANQACRDSNCAQQDTQFGRFGDWSRAPQSWLGYRPHHDDHQRVGQCRRWIFRCLNVGTRLRQLSASDVAEAFSEAQANGSAILSFADHDYRDLRPDVRRVRELLQSVRKDFPGVRIRFSGAEDAAQRHLAHISPDITENAAPEFSLTRGGSRLHIRLMSGRVFGPQPFLALKTRNGRYLHDNLDVIEPGSHWTYVLDGQTMAPEELSDVGVGAAGPRGGYGVSTLRMG
ncbi:MAG: hypothetical protein KKD25_19395 [Gammaproteobacteria bacterium]|nr:hypothetical protein [Gammaproteobacteria bacterium]MBU0769885.1 hypothetical protein [Gammaproteobacteria bacterium]MBU0854690.1 hypothetical protein [Gammaproteobacteria bacterium]MBU1845437.1 hypothetical protein [Gammaproteobacteria bacterium]